MAIQSCFLPVGTPFVELLFQNLNHTFSPEQGSSKILKHHREFVQNRKSSHVSKGFIAVPANFSDNQRRGTIEAAFWPASVQMLSLPN
jgi:molecular chaperone DnaK (HSP70)